MPQSTAHTTRSTVILSPLTVTSATCATTEPKDSCTATPRPRPFSFENGESHPAFSAASLSAPTWRGCSPSNASRKAIGSCRAACASSSIITSLENAMCVFSTERHHSTGTPAAGGERVDAHLLGLQSDRRRGIRLVDGLELAAGPDLALVGAQLAHRGQGLHRRVREVRKLELPLHALHRMCKRRLDVAALRNRDGLLAAAQGVIFLHELRRAALLGA